MFRYSVANEIIRRVSENKFKETLNTRPHYEYAQQMRID